jgi:hypothetical protein
MTRARAKTSKKTKAALANSSSTPALASKLAKALHALAGDLSNPADESTDFFHPFVAPLSPDIKLDAAAFQRALKIGGRYKVDLSSADDLLSGAEDADNSGEETAAGFRLLEKVMRATLSDLSVAFARGNNVVRVRMWLFGRSEDGSLVGLRSMTTET